MTPFPNGTGPANADTGPPAPHAAAGTGGTSAIGGAHGRPCLSGAAFRRFTLPALLGRARAVGLLKGLLALELLCCAAVGFAWFPGGVWAILPCGAGLIWNGQKLVHSGLVPAVRVQSMGLAMQNNLWVFLTCAAVAVLHLLCVGGK